MNEKIFQPAFNLFRWILVFLLLVAVSAEAVIIIMSSMHLLRVFNHVVDIPNEKIVWYVILHLNFVVSAIVLGFLYKIVFQNSSDRSKFSQ